MEHSIPRLASRLVDEADAYEFLEELRWAGKPVCPHCGNDDKCYYLVPKDEEGRKTRTGSRSQRRVWKCAKCRKQFSAVTGTVMHGTKIPIRTWVLVIFEMSASKNGISSREIERKYDVQPVVVQVRAQIGQPSLGGIRSARVGTVVFLGGALVLVLIMVIIGSLGQSPYGRR